MQNFPRTQQGSNGGLSAVPGCDVKRNGRPAAGGRRVSAPISMAPLELFFSEHEEQEPAQQRTSAER